MKNICVPIDMRRLTRDKSMSNAWGGGYRKEGDPIYTLTTIKDFIPGVLYMEFYENHPNDSRVNGPYEICPTLSGRMGTGGGNTPLVREKVSAYDSHPMDSRVTEIKDDGKCQTLTKRFGMEYDPNTILVREEQMETKGEYIVRRITPTECERLQGFPDGYTDIPWPNAEHAPDSHRYKALGNSFCVPVVRWIGERIEYALSHPITEDKSDKIPWQPELF